jgi:hypothetical protein
LPQLLQRPFPRENVPVWVPTSAFVGAPDIDVELTQLLERSFPRENVPEWVRIRWSLRTVANLHNILPAEIDEAPWLHADEKIVLRRLCGIV